jgi:hypothetical protein
MDIKITEIHSMQPDEIKLRFENKIKHYQNSHLTFISNYSSEWEGNTGYYTFHIFGTKINAVVNIQTDRVTIESKLQQTALAQKNIIEELLKNNLKEILR